MSNVRRFYNLNLAIELDETLNKPYNHEEGPKCDVCLHTNANEFDITGIVIDDGSGLFVEKTCQRCGTLTDDGNGDFHDIYEILSGETIQIIEKQRV